MSSESTGGNDWKVIATLGLTLLGILAATGVGLYTIHENNISDRRRANDAFVLAAAQVVMAQPSCKLSQARARQLVEVFPTLRRPFHELTQHPLSASLCKQLRKSAVNSSVLSSLLGPLYKGPTVIFPLPKDLQKVPTITLTNPFKPATTTTGR